MVDEPGKTSEEWPTPTREEVAAKFEDVVSQEAGPAGEAPPVTPATPPSVSDGEPAPGTAPPETPPAETAIEFEGQSYTPEQFRNMVSAYQNREAVDRKVQELQREERFIQEQKDFLAEQRTITERLGPQGDEVPATGEEGGKPESKIEDYQFDPDTDEGKHLNTMSKRLRASQEKIRQLEGKAEESDRNAFTGFISEHFERKLNELFEQKKISSPRLRKMYHDQIIAQNPPAFDSTGRVTAESIAYNTEESFNTVHADMSGYEKEVEARIHEQIRTGPKPTVPPLTGGEAPSVKSAQPKKDIGEWETQRTTLHFMNELAERERAARGE